MLTIFSGACFVLYGVLCVFSESMKAEFKRYGLDHFRMMTGILELLGGLGQLVGFQWRPAFFIATAGLALLMGAGLIVRIKIKDSLAQSFQALFFLVLNAYLFISSMPVL
jgi:uncharacterized membrane protein YphA (DoxX/SURF4 family)